MNQRIINRRGVLFILLTTYSWLALSYLIAINTVRHGHQLDENQRWIEPYIGQNTDSILFSGAAIGVLLAAWSVYETGLLLRTKRMRKGIDKKINDMLRLSHTREILLSLANEEQIAFTQSGCAIPHEYLRYASSHQLARLLLALMRAHDKNIVQLLARTNHYDDTSNTVFHSIASHFELLLPDEVKRIVGYIRDECTLFGDALEAAIHYTRLENEIKTLQREQRRYVFDFPAENTGITKLQSKDLGTVAQGRLNVSGLLFRTMARLVRLKGKTASMKTAA